MLLHGNIPAVKEQLYNSFAEILKALVGPDNRDRSQIGQQAHQRGVVAHGQKTFQSGSYLCLSDTAEGEILSRPFVYCLT